MSVIPQTPELPGGFAPLVPCQGSALDPLGTLSGPQTPRPLTINPGSAPGYNNVRVVNTNKLFEVPHRPSDDNDTSYVSLIFLIFFYPTIYSRVRL